MEDRNFYGYKKGRVSLIKNDEKKSFTIEFDYGTSLEKITFLSDDLDNLRQLLNLFSEHSIECIWR
jgi:hypothetical protein